MNFNTQPYFDDYDKDKGFQKVLFKPSNPVQTRELNQIQSILQNQISNLGDHFFKEGSMVIPGGASLNTSVEFFFVNDINVNGVPGNLDRLYDVKNTTLLEVDNEGNFTGKEIFVKYPEIKDNEYRISAVVTNAGDTNEDEVLPGERYQVVIGNDIFVLEFDTVDHESNVFKTIGSVAVIEEGVYYVRGYLVNVLTQEIIIDSNDANPSISIGLTISEEIVTASDDPTLYDNASGFINVSSEGADRYKISLVLSTRPYAMLTQDSYIELIRVREGEIEKKVESSFYHYFEKEMSKQNYASHGDFVKDPFLFTIKEMSKVFSPTEGMYDVSDFACDEITEVQFFLKVYFEAYLKDNEVDNFFVCSIENVDDYEDVGFEAGKIYPCKSPEELLSEMEKRYVVTLDPGEAMISGRMVRTLSNKEIIILKPQETGVINNQFKTTTEQPHIYVTDVCGLPTCGEKIFFKNTSRENINGTTFLRGEVEGISVTIGEAVVTSVEYMSGDMTWYYLNSYGREEVGDRNSQQGIWKVNLSVPKMYKWNDLSNNLINAPKTFIPFDNIRSYVTESKTFGNVLVRYEVVGDHTPTMLKSEGIIKTRNETFKDWLHSRLIRLTDNEMYVLPYYDMFSDEVYTNLSNSNKFDFSEYAPQNNRMYWVNEALSFQEQLNIDTTTLILSVKSGSVVNTTGEETLLISPNHQYVKTFLNELGATDTSYIVSRSLMATASTSHTNTAKTSVIFELSNTNERFVNSGLFGYSGHIYSNESASFGKPLLIRDSDIVISNDNRTVEVTMDSSYIGLSVVLNLPIRKNVLQRKKESKKEIIVGKSLQDDSSINLTEYYNNFSLEFADVYELDTVWEFSHSITEFVTDDAGNTTELSSMTQDNFNYCAKKYKEALMNLENGLITADAVPVKVTEITDKFTLLTNQDSLKYGISSLTLNNLSDVPSGRISVSYKRFTHSSGDYFSVDSYPFSTVSLPNASSTPNPYVSLDFRCVEIFDKTTGKTKIDTNNFEFIIPSVEVTYDYVYKMINIGSLSISKGDGDEPKFEWITGTPDAFKPMAPKERPGSMELYSITLTPESPSPTTVDVKPAAVNKRSNASIESLQQRLDRLEYTVSLSLVEQKTMGENVLDANGNSRFKSGIFVDSFENHLNGKTDEKDYLCSMDNNGTLKPAFEEESIDLKLEKGNRNNIVIRDNKVFIKYTEVEFASQLMATRHINVNPYAIFSFFGVLKLTPSSDTWKDTKTLPAQVINQDARIPNLSSLTSRMGTQWGSWRTTWQGTSTRSTSSITGWRKDSNSWTFNKAGGFCGSGGCGWRKMYAQRRTTTTKTTTTQQTRTGTSLSAGTRTITRNLGERVVENQVVPYIRSRNVLVTGSRFKPNVTLKSFFDGVNVDKYIEPMWYIDFVSSEHKFDQILTDNETRYTDSTRVNTFAVFAKQVIDIEKNVFRIVINKLSGDPRNFNLQKITSLSQTSNILGETGAVGRFTKLKTDNFGDLYQVFAIPNNKSLRFKTGKRTLEIRDTDDPNTAKTQAQVEYTATGVLEVRQGTVINTRTSTIQTNTVTDNRRLTSRKTTTSTSEDKSTFRWWDPVAETFAVTEEGGISVTSIDVYFATKSPNVPVTMQIREVVNGYPGRKVLSEVVLPAYKVRTDSTYGRIPTKFTFDAPVYLPPEEWCFVLLSDCVDYEVYCCTMGQKILGENGVAFKQPYAGVMFKSQNGSTWTADQNSDLKFIINKAKFDKGVGSCSLVKDYEDVTGVEIGYEDVTTNHFFINEDKPTQLIVNLRNHNNYVGSYVKFKNVPNVVVNGVKLGELNNSEFKVVDMDYQSFTIELESSMFEDGFGASAYGDISLESTILVSRNFSFNVASLNVTDIELTDTKINYYTKFIDGRSRHSSQTPYIETSLGEVEIINNEDIYLPTPMLNASRVNEERFITRSDKNLGDLNNSVVINVELSTSNANVSPVIDLDRASMTMISNITNKPNPLAPVGDHNNGYVSGLIEETAPNGGSVAAKWISKPIVTEIPGIGVKVFLDMYTPSKDDLKLYIRHSKIEEEMFEKEWIEISPKDILTDGEFEAEFLYDTDAEFSVYQYKITMTTSNSSDVPYVTSMRSIILGT